MIIGSRDVTSVYFWKGVSEVCPAKIFLVPFLVVVADEMLLLGPVSWLSNIRSNAIFAL